MKKRIFIIFPLPMLMLLTSCVTSRIEHYNDYQPDPSRPPIFGEDTIEEYHFISWEPYHFFLTLGILPQYHYAVIRNESGGFEKHSQMIGWVAIPLALSPSWDFGLSPEDADSQQCK